MAATVSQPQALCLSAFIEDIVFSTSEEKGDLTVTLTCGGTAQTVLEETLWADSDGKVRVGDLASLVEPYAREYRRVVMGCTFDDDDTAASIDPVTVVYGKADVGMAADTFLSSHFLTVLDGEKLTAYNRREILSAYNAVEVTVNADVRLADGTFATRTATLQATVTEEGISAFDVSPNNISTVLSLENIRLLAYTVAAGNRSQRFRMVRERIDPEPSLLFVNSFGCLECLHCVGTRKREGKFTRSSARISGNLRNYKITEERKFTANTGWMNDAMAEWAEDVLRSTEVYLLENGEQGHEVVITDSKSEYSNEEDFMTAYEISYVYAQHIHNVMRLRNTQRIFSDHYDEKYN